MRYRVTIDIDTDDPAATPDDVDEAITRALAEFPWYAEVTEVQEEP